MPGRLWSPQEGEDPFPLVLLSHGAGGAKDAPNMDAAAGLWAMRGLAVASIDLPLHGERAEAKLSQLLLAELSAGDGPLGLAAEFVRQTLSDLSRALQAVAELPEIDADRIGYAGFSLDSIVGAPFCSGAPLVRAAALVIGGAGPEIQDLGAAGPIAAFSPRPLLLVNARNDKGISHETAEALFEAAGEPKEQLCFDGTHTQLPDATLKAMFEFFAEHLEVSRPT